MYTIKKDYALAWDFNKNASSLNDKNSSNLMTEADFLVNGGEFRKGLIKYKKAFSMCNRPQIVSKIAEINDFTRIFKDSIVYCLEAIEIEPENDYYQFQLGCIYLSQEREHFVQVEHMFQNMFMRNADSYYGKLLEIKLYLSKHQYIKALEKIDDLLKHRFQDKKGLLYKMQALFGLEKFEEAVELGKESKKIYLNDFKILCWIAKSIAMLNSFNEAKEIIEQAEKFESNHPEFLIYAAEVYNLGFFNVENQQIFKRMIKLWPNDQLTLGAYKRLKNLNNFNGRKIINSKDGKLKILKK